MRAARQRNRCRKTAFEQLEPRAMLAAAPLAVLPFSPAVADPAALVGALLVNGSGLNIVPGSIQYQGIDGQAGFFSRLDAQDTAADVRLALADGILLTTGSAALTLDNNSTAAGAVAGTAGDAELAALLGPDPQGSAVPTFDANRLQFQFTVAAGIQSLSLRFVFASEEYPEFIGSRFNDVLGIFVDGRQLAMDESENPVTVNNGFLRLNNSGKVDPNAATDKIPVNFSTIEYDGLTRVLVLKAQLDPHVPVHTLKIGVADGGDSVIDSAVFLAALKGSDQNVVDGVTEIIDRPMLETPVLPEIPLVATPVLIPFSTGTLVAVTTTDGVFPQATIGAAAAVVSRPSDPRTLIAPLRAPAGLFSGGGDVESVDSAIVDAKPLATPRVNNSELQLIAFTQQRGSGGSEQLAGMLMSLADVEEPRLLAIEYGDEVVRREAKSNQQVVSKPVAAQQPPVLNGDAGPTSADAPTGFAWNQYWWLLAIPTAAAAAAAGWFYRQRLFGNMGTLLRRLGL